MDIVAEVQELKKRVAKMDARLIEMETVKDRYAELLDRVLATEEKFEPKAKPEKEEQDVPFERVPPGDPQHPAVQAYRDAYRRYPPKASYYELAETIGDDPETIKEWHAHCLSCAKKGWNPGNVNAVLDTWKKLTSDPYRSVSA